MRNYLYVALDIISQQGVLAFFSYCLKELYRIMIRQWWYSSYAQHWEDIEIHTLFSNKTDGFYVDIGAHHPTRLSNTYRLYKSGWSGLTVEPNIEVTSLFERARPRDIHLSVGVGTEEKKMPFYRFTIPALSTFSREAAQESQSKGFTMVGKESVSVIPVSKLLSYIPKKKKIDLLSLDTEGWDLPILQDWDFVSFPPQLICVEEGAGFIQTKKLLLHKGYTHLFSNGTNSFFMKK